MMRKLVAITLIFSILMAALSGCTLLAAGIIAGVDEETATQENSMDAQGSEKSEHKTNELKAVIQETVLYNDEDYTITAVGIDSEFNDTVINLLVENRTDRNIALKGNYFVVNGITVSGWMYINVAAQKKAKGDLRLYGSSLESAGITQIATLYAYDAEILDSDDILGEEKEMPLLIETQLAGNYEQEINDDGEVIWESNGITVISQIIDDRRFVHRVKLLIRNDTDENISLTADNVSVNGFTLTGILLENVAAYTVAFGDLTIFESELEENGIEEIENVTFSIKATPEDDILTTLAESGELEVQVNK